MRRLYLTDTLNFLRKLRWKRLLNMALVIASYLRMRLGLGTQQWGLPFTLSIEPTTACNLQCPECPSGLRQFSRPTGRLRQDFFRRTIDEISDHLLYLIFYFQGEPYLNPDFLQMVRYAADRGIYTITSTNAHFLDSDHARATVESGLDRLIISVDGASQEVYEQYRIGGSLEKVLEGARQVVHWKRQLGATTPHLIFQMLVVRPNEHQLTMVRDLAHSIGINEVVYKTAQLYDYQNGHPLMPKQERYRRYRQRSDGRYELGYELVDRCWKSWHSCVISWDGRVAPCCFDKDLAYQLGDLKKESLRSVWFGQKRHQFLNRIQAGRSQISICTNCTEGCKVWLGAEN